MEAFTQFWAAIAIWLACIWVAIGQWYLTFSAMTTIGKNPKMSTYYLTIAILWIALVESAAIYWLIMAFQILLSTTIDPLAAIWVGLAIWLSGLWVGIWEGKMISWAFDAMNKEPENKNKIMTYMILFLALIESAAIYGLVVGFQILSDTSIDWYLALASWLSIWLAGLWVWVGEWILAQKALHVISYDFKRAGYYLTVAILGIALVESAAIYGLIIAFQTLSFDSINTFGIIGAGLAVWFAWLWVWIGEWKMVAWALEWMYKNPENRGKLLTFMILFLALIESAAIYGLITSFQIITSENISAFYAIWAWLSIWLAGLWVWVGEWILARKSLEVMSEDIENNSFYLTISILGIALVESAAIYWLILSMQLLNSSATLELAAIGIGLAIWLAGLWVWIWEWKMVSWALQAMKQNPESKRKIMTFMILFLALIESAAIYALVVSFQLLNNTSVFELAALWAGIAVWAAWLWVGIGEGLLSRTSLIAMWEKPHLQWYFLTVTILGIALVESAAIYALVIGFQLIWDAGLNLAQAIGMWLAVWLAGLWVWIGEGNMISWAMKAIETSPENKNKILTFMILFLALIESAAIYGLVMAFQIMWNEVTMLTSIWIWLSVWLAGLWVGVWEWILARRAMDVISTDFKNSGYYLTVTILGIALVESAAIYGLIMWVQLLTTNFVDSLAAVWVWLAVWLAWLWVWIWEWKMVWEAMEAMKMDPKNRKKILTFMILFIALIESVAIYGLVVWTQILSTLDMNGYIAIWAGLAIWLAWLGVWVGEWILSSYSMDVIWKKSKMQSTFLTTTILWVALAESAAIYGLVIAFQVLGLAPEMALAWLWAWAAIWLAALGAGIWEGMLVGWTFCSMYRNPSLKSRDLAFMVLFLALIEVLAIYGLIVAFQILS